MTAETSKQSSVPDKIKSLNLPDLARFNLARPDMAAMIQETAGDRFLNKTTETAIDRRGTRIGK